MSTTSLTAGEIMDRSAALLNDPARTDFTYAAQLPYLNMAIDELMEIANENQAPLTNSTASVIVVPKGVIRLIRNESVAPLSGYYPMDLVEIQEIGERPLGSAIVHRQLPRYEFQQSVPPCESLVSWAWEDQQVKFNSIGATIDMEVYMRYIRRAFDQAIDESSVIGTIGARSYLSYKTAALCAIFIGENESRARILNEQAEKSIERIEGIINKGKQIIVTRHRPFRASYKAKSWL